MKIRQLLAILLLLSAVEARKNGRRRHSQKHVSKTERLKPMKSFFASPTSCKSCRSKGNKCFDHGNIIGGFRVAGLDDVETSLNNTRPLFDKLTWSLQVLTNNMSFNGKHDIHYGQRTTELNPTAAIRLTSDKEFKLLGQTVYWLNWIGASLRVVQELDRRASNGGKTQGIVPNVSTPYGPVDLDRVIADLRLVQSSVDILRKQVGFGDEQPEGDKGGKKKKKNKKGNRKGGAVNPLQCLKVKVMRVCRNTHKDCTQVRERAYVMMRDMLRAVLKIKSAFRPDNCDVKAGRVQAGARCSLTCQNRSVFYHSECIIKACDLQKWRCRGTKKRCLQRSFV